MRGWRVEGEGEFGSLEGEADEVDGESGVLAVVDSKRVSCFRWWGCCVCNGEVVDDGRVDDRKKRCWIGFDVVQHGARTFD